MYHKNGIPFSFASGVHSLGTCTCSLRTHTPSIPWFWPQTNEELSTRSLWWHYLLNLQSAWIGVFHVWKHDLKYKLSSTMKENWSQMSRDLAGFVRQHTVRIGEQGTDYSSHGLQWFSHKFGDSWLVTRKSYYVGLKSVFGRKLANSHARWKR